MKKVSVGVLFCLVMLIPAYGYENPQNITSFGGTNTVLGYEKITEVFTGDWQKYGQPFMVIQKNYVKSVYSGVILAVVGAFLLHYLLIGPKKFSHEGRKVLVFNIFNRIVHWFTAVSFLVIFLSGLSIIFGKYLGGGSLVLFLRYAHSTAALVFVPFAILMLLMWIKDMIIAPGDITWFLKFGGYLSKNENIMPVGKFNPGQKSWFWLGTLGGMIMAYTGYFLFTFNTSTDMLRIYVMIHNGLGVAFAVLFLVHLYMSLFAIKGSLQSMISGYKHEDELRVMHSRFYNKIFTK